MVSEKGVVTTKQLYQALPKLDGVSHLYELQNLDAKDSAIQTLAQSVLGLGSIKNAHFDKSSIERQTQAKIERSARGMFNYLLGSKIVWDTDVLPDGSINLQEVAARNTFIDPDKLQKYITFLSTYKMSEKMRLRYAESNSAPLKIDIGLTDNNLLFGVSETVIYTEIAPKKFMRINLASSSEEKKPAKPQFGFTKRLANFAQAALGFLA